MKKINILLFVIVALTLFASCDSIDDLLIMEYRGEEISEIIYESIDYMGGSTDIHKISFTDNKVYFKENDGEFKEIKTFTDEEEIEFINTCYSNGLFGIAPRYENKNIIDGGGWSLVINYKNGNNKISTGSNDAPVIVFKRCAVPFFDFCGERVLGSLPENFFEPPNLQLSVPVLSDDGSKVISVGYDVAVADYYWNEGRFSSDNTDLYAINEELLKTQEMIDTNEKILFRKTVYEDFSGFSRFVFKSYDYNPELSGEKIIEDRIFFNEGEYALEPDKIYVYEMYFKNGEYIRRTFNTKSSK